MTQKMKIKGWLNNSKIRGVLLAGLWLVLLTTVAIPSWRGVIIRNSEISDLEERLATLDDWTVAGLWLAPSVRQRSLPVNAAFSRLFPSLRGREELFLSLAQVADESGVVDFGLSEMTNLGMIGNDVWSDGGNMGSEMEEAPPESDSTDMPAQSAQGNALSIPSIDLKTYRVKANFSGDYKRIAQFMGQINKIDRALKVHSLVIRPEKDEIRVDLELDVYVSQTS